MTKLSSLVARSVSARRQQGVTMIEYALIAALIAVVLVVVLQGLGTQLDGTFQAITDALSGANTAGTP